MHQTPHTLTCGSIFCSVRQGSSRPLPVMERRGAGARDGCLPPPRHICATHLLENKSFHLRIKNTYYNKFQGYGKKKLRHHNNRNWEKKHESLDRSTFGKQLNIDEFSVVEREIIFLTMFCPRYHNSKKKKDRYPKNYVEIKAWNNCNYNRCENYKRTWKYTIFEDTSEALKSRNSSGQDTYVGDK